MAINLGSAYGKVSLDTTAFSSGVTKAKQSLDSLVHGGNNAGKSIAEIGASMKRTGAFMTAAFTVPLAIAGKKAFDTFREFEQSLNVLKTVSGATDEEMKKLSDTSRALGADLTLPGTSAADAADAMAELAKAGLNVNEILDASRGVLQLSIAGQMSNAEAAKITANALNAFSLEGTEAARVADLLAAAALASTAEVKEMADSLQMSTAVAAMSGMKIEELVASIALMSNAGIQGSDAGTSIKQMLLSLQTPTQKSSDLMRDLGINVYDAAGNMKSMREIIQIFSTQLRGLTEQQRNYALGTIFGSDATRAANILLMGGVDAYDKMSASVNKTGAAAGLAASMMEGLTGSVENIKSAFETASIAAIEPFKDDIKVMLDFVAKAINAFATLPEPVRKVIVIVLLLVAAIGPLLILLGTVLPFVLGKATQSMNPFHFGIFGLIGSLVKFIALAATVVRVLTFLGISTGPAGAAIMGLNGAITGVASSIWTALLPALGAVGTALLSLGIFLLAAGAVVLQFAIAWKLNLFWIRDNVHMVVTVVKNMWKALMAFLRGDTDAALGYVQAAFQAVVDRIMKILGNLSGLRDAWNSFVTWLGSTMGRARDFIVSAFSKTDWAQVGRFIVLGIANGMLLGLPTLLATALRVATAALAQIKKTLGISSPSKAFEELGKYSAQGYQVGLAKQMGAEDIARTMGKSVQSVASSQQQSNTFNFSGGVTVREVQGMLARNSEDLLMSLNRAMGGA